MEKLKFAEGQKKILGFPIRVPYAKRYLDTLNAKALFALACEDEEVIIYDCLDDFLAELNNDLVDTENHWWYSA